MNPEDDQMSATSRTRTLTEKGEEQYIQRRDKLSQDVELLWSMCNAILQETDNPPSEERKCLELEQKVVQAYTRYNRLCEEYLVFVKGQRTNLANQDLDVISPVIDVRKRMYDSAIANLHEVIRQTSIAKSVKSTKSKSNSETSSSKSNTSSLAKRTRAKAEAAKAAIAFAEKQALMAKQEAELHERAVRESSRVKAQMEQEAIRQKTQMEEEAARREAEVNRRKAEIKAEMTLLETQRQAAELEAEARILEQEDDMEQDLDDPLPVPTDDPLKRVKDYVHQHSVHSQQEYRTQNADYQVTSAIPKYTTRFSRPAHSGLGLSGNPKEELDMTTAIAFNNRPSYRSHIGDFGLPSATSTPMNDCGHIPVTQTRTSGLSRLNTNAPVFTPCQDYPMHSASSPVDVRKPISGYQDTGSDPTPAITKFLLRKDLIFSRLSTFNDRAESYHIWKSSFESVIRELDVSDSEKLDLLVKWLGTESSKHAVSIRASNADNPTRGLQRLWQRLDERYGCPEMIEASLKTKLTDFPKLTNKDNKRLYELSDILSEIEYIKEKPQLKNLLAYFDSSSGIRPIVSKLPFGLQEKWTARAVRYNKQHSTSFPPFTEFSAFIREISRIRNNPGFTYDSEPVISSQKGSSTRSTSKPQAKIGVHKTDASNVNHLSDRLENCILHGSKHSLNDCRGFRSKPMEERRTLLKDNKVCFKCCDSNKHVSRDCPVSVSCKECGSKQHTTALHINKSNKPASQSVSKPAQNNGGESGSTTTVNTVNSSCTEICKEYGGKSCAKILPVIVFHKDHPGYTKKMYAIIDDQSNRSLASPEFFQYFNVRDVPETYTLSTCSGKITTSGRRGKDFIVTTIDGSDPLVLPVLIECDNIPDNRNEIPTPDIASKHPHLGEIAKHLSPLDDSCTIMLLIGRDLPEAHHVHGQKLGPLKAPYAQRLKLGWVVVGETCLDKQHVPTDINVNRTYVSTSGRPTVLKPCENNFEIREQFPNYNSIGQDVFIRTPDDDKPGMSHDDKQFMKQMDDEFVRDDAGSWVAPLPFRATRPRLPNNRDQAVQRAKMLDTNLKKNPVKKAHLIEFMGNILDNNHAEVAPPLKENEECWYLPLFGVYHPKKPDKIRGVFDSSAKYNGISLNNVLLTGPDLTNSLLGVLVRFRREKIAVTADVQHMFHCFVVRDDHRNYLRFLWYKDNNPNEELIEYRMRVHVFGNSPSPTVATLGLRKAALESESKYGSHVPNFVINDFYVDDGLTSCETPEEAVILMKDTQNALMEYGNLRLHKFASNSPEVMAEFPSSDLASNLKDLNLNADDKPLQRSLGLIWDVNTDNFLFQLSTEDKPVTRRGILSTINSIFDPLGFLAPVIIHGKLLLRTLVSETIDWDQPVSDELAIEWENWRDSLHEIENLRIPRTYVANLNNANQRELHVFSDASEKAIAAVVYLRTVETVGEPQLGFVLGKTKVAPISGHTIPRLELCAAVLAVELAQSAIDHLQLSIDEVKYYTDSRVVLGYISNDTRRFYTYVANRVEKIRKHSKPDEWNYVPSNLNPADSGTRFFQPSDIHDSDWLLGPKRLLINVQSETTDASQHTLVEPETDKEIRPVVKVAKTCTVDHIPTWDERFSDFSSWSKLTRFIAVLKAAARKLHGHKSASMCSPVDIRQDAELFIIREVQSRMFGEEIDCLLHSEPVSRRSVIAKLNPFLDELGLLRVGGRIVKSDLPFREKLPLVIPGRHHITDLLVRHFHHQVKHQGRHFTEGAIRAAGFWIVGAKRTISSVLHKCVLCRKLRGRQESQIMADLPADRLEPSPPFTNVGVDAFGPWEVVARKTRGGLAKAKRWAILFTCLVTRAVHIELVDEMSSSAFINALTRFTSIRGKVKTFRSDCGTNFVGAIDKIGVDAINVEDNQMRKHMLESGTVWIFNAPHSSHMGGAWERMIGITRRILDSMILENPGRTLTHDVLNTFMAEATAIINSRPLVPVSSDSENPLILTPSMLLTQKTDYVFSIDSKESFSKQDLCLAEWRRVGALSSMFWSRWRKEYLSLLQQRRKWTEPQRDIIVGDVVLIRDKNLDRNKWPTGLVTAVFKSEDGHTRKAEVRVIVDGKPAKYTRPIVDMILLVESIL